MRPNSFLISATVFSTSASFVTCSSLSLHSSLTLNESVSQETFLSVANPSSHLTTNMTWFINGNRNSWLPRLFLCAITINYLHKFINQIHTCLPLLTSRHVQCKSLDRNLIRLTYLCCHSLQLVLRMYCQWASGNWFWTQWTNVTMKCKVLPATNAGSIPWQHAIVNVPIFSGAWNSNHWLVGLSSTKSTNASLAPSAAIIRAHTAPKFPAAPVITAWAQVLFTFATGYKKLCTYCKLHHKLHHQKK